MYLPTRCLLKFAYSKELRSSEVLWSGQCGSVGEVLEKYFHLSKDGKKRVHQYMDDLSEIYSV